jgi:hypothetical protein
MLLAEDLRLCNWLEEGQIPLLPTKYIVMSTQWFAASAIIWESNIIYKNLLYSVLHFSFCCFLSLVWLLGDHNSFSALQIHYFARFTHKASLFIAMVVKLKIGQQEYIFVRMSLICNFNALVQFSSRKTQIKNR